jgi:Ulp1 family protease
MFPSTALTDHPVVLKIAEKLEQLLPGEEFRIIERDSPQQQTSFDCGVLMLWNMRKRIEERLVPRSVLLSQNPGREDLEAFRRGILSAMLFGRL